MNRYIISLHAGLTDGKVTISLWGMEAEQVLEESASTLTSRGKEYDAREEKERSMVDIVQVFNIVTQRSGDRGLSEEEGWEFMACLKKVRGWRSGGYHHDSHVDECAYVALKAETKRRSRQKKIVAVSEKIS